MGVRRNRIVTEEVYWTPPAKKEGDSSIPTPKPQEHIYYVPPQTPQEAIEQGVVARVATRPKNFLHHWERLGLAHKPKHWHCWWGCEGVQSVLDGMKGPTHDYYCPYWEMLLLFPEWEEDFSYSLTERPPRPSGGPALNEEETRSRIEEIRIHKEKLREYKQGIKSESKSNPFNMSDDDYRLQGFGATSDRSTSRKSRSSGKTPIKKITNNNPSFGPAKAPRKRRSS